MHILSKDYKNLIIGVEPRARGCWKLGAPIGIESTVRFTFALLTATSLLLTASPLDAGSEARGEDPEA
jgi:hypothetical protein